MIEIRKALVAFLTHIWMVYFKFFRKLFLESLPRVVGRMPHGNMYIWCFSVIALYYV
jgi:hypothetical protein